MHIKADTKLQDSENEENIASCNEGISQIQKKLAVQNGILQVQNVKNITAFVKHLIEPPKLFIGSNQNLLREIFKAVTSNQITLFLYKKENVWKKLKKFKAQLI